MSEQCLWGMIISPQPPRTKNRRHRPKQSVCETPREFSQNRANLIVEFPESKRRAFRSGILRCADLPNSRIAAALVLLSRPIVACGGYDRKKSCAGSLSATLSYCLPARTVRKQQARAQTFPALDPRRPIRSLSEKTPPDTNDRGEPWPHLQQHPAWRLLFSGPRTRGHSIDQSLSKQHNVLPGFEFPMMLGPWPTSVATSVTSGAISCTRRCKWELFASSPVSTGTKASISEAGKQPRRENSS